MGLVVYAGKSFLASLVLSIAMDTAYLKISGVLFLVWILLGVFNNLTAKLQQAHPSTPVPKGKIRICVAGMTHSSPTSKAHYLAAKLAKAHPDKYETWYFFDAYQFYPFTAKKFANVDFPQHLKGHGTSPFCWLEHPAADGSPENRIEPLGGSEYLSEWAIKNSESKDVVAAAKESAGPLSMLTGRAFHCWAASPQPTAAGCITAVVN